MNLNQYRHDRARPVKETVPELYRFIEEFSGTEPVLGWYEWFEKHFRLPPSVVRQYLKKYLSEEFDYLDRQGFSRSLSLLSLPVGLLKMLGFLGIIYLKKQRVKPKRYDVDLILDHIESTDAIFRFRNLILLFGEKNVAAIVPGNELIDGSGILVMNRPRFINYRIELRELMHILLQISYLCVLSIRTRTNLMSVTAHALNSYFYYRTIFENVKGKHCLMFQQYHTNSIKNYLFRELGGKSSSTIQKNIPPQGHNGLYYDSDIFFSLGNKTAERPEKLGGRFDRIVPVGSLFFESAWYCSDEENRVLDKEWDVMYIGINHFGAAFEDIYSACQDDYYEQISWLMKLSRAYPRLRIGIAHHANNNRDPAEIELIKDTNIVRMDENLCSYRFALNSRLIATFASTMGFEMLGCDLPTIFLDPGGRNNQFLPDTEESDIIRIKSSEALLTFWSTFDRLEVTSMKMLTPSFTSENWCKKSDCVSGSIYTALTNFRRN